MNDNTPDTIDGLLIKVILGEASPEEIRQAEEWTGASEANRRYAAHFSTIWEDSRKLAVHSGISEQDAWDRFRLRVDSGSASAGAFAEAAQSGETTTPAPERPGAIIPLPRNGVYTWLRVAAAVLIIISGFLIYRSYNIQSAEWLTIRSGNLPVTDTLSDGTIVTLNKSSSIKYKGRQVELQGEAFFEVAPDQNSSFTVRSDGATITVLGTSFNVRALPARKATEIIVETGRVRVTKDTASVTIGAQEKLLITAEQPLAAKQKNPDELYSYYKTHEFVCNATPLSRLVSVLNDAYNTHIVIANDKLGRLPLTSTFSDESVDEILDIVAKTLSITVLRKDGQIVLQ